MSLSQNVFYILFETLLKLIASVFSGLNTLFSGFITALTVFKYTVVSVGDVFSIAFSMVPGIYIQVFILSVSGVVLWSLLRGTWGA